MKVYTIHGNGQTSEIFKKLDVKNIEHITLPGHDGRNFDTDCTYENCILYVNQTIKEECILIGLSLGGHLALRVTENPLVKAVISMCAPPISPTTVHRLYLPNDDITNFHSHEATDEQLYDFCSLQSKSKENIELIFSMIKKQKPMARPEFMGSVLSNIPNEIEILKKMDIPYYILNGTKDRIVNIDFIKEISGDLPNIYFKFYECEHNIPLEKPEILTAIVDQLRKK